LSFRQKVESPGLSKRRFCAFDWPKRRSACLGLSSFWRNDHTESVLCPLEDAPQDHLRGGQLRGGTCTVEMPFATRGRHAPIDLILGQQRMPGPLEVGSRRCAGNGGGRLGKHDVLRCQDRLAAGSLPLVVFSAIREQNRCMTADNAKTTVVFRRKWCVILHAAWGFSH